MQDKSYEVENEVVSEDQEPVEEPYDFEDRIYEEWLERKLFGGE